MDNLLNLLTHNPYPGRGIILGRTPDSTCTAIAYFIMGRSENSRNRVFSKTADGIRTAPFDGAKMTDPSLIIYHPVRMVNGHTIITNGDQTDTICDALADGRDYIHALRTRTFEPDAPNYTPRISGVLAPDGSYTLSILKSSGGDPACAVRAFFEYEAPIAGVGHFIHTYQGDGNPLPSFAGEPRMVAIDANDPAEFAHSLWNSLNADNRVSLFVRFVNLRTGAWTQEIYNCHKGVAK